MKKNDIDQLFALPLAEFTAARNALAARLKREGRGEEAERVKSMPKPSATAWAVNQLYWREPDAIDRLLKNGEKVRKAQTGNAGDLRALLEERRALVSDLTKRASQLLRDSKHASTLEATRKISTTLESLAAWGSAKAKEQLGRLATDLDPLGFDDLAALLEGKQLPRAKVLPFRQPDRGKKSVVDLAAIRAERKESAKAAEKALTAARREEQQAEAALTKATARAEALEAEKRELEDRLREAGEAARSAGGEAKKKAHARAEAERALERARAALDEK